MSAIKNLLNEEVKGKLDEDKFNSLSDDQAIELLIESEYADVPAITDSSMQQAVFTAIKNVVSPLQEDATVTGDIKQYTPVAINLIRRVLPTLVGPRMVGMQPLKTPTGRIFVQHVYIKDMNTGGATKQEIWAPGTVGTADAAAVMQPDLTGPYATATAEAFGYPGGQKYNEMSFAISSVDVGVSTRALKGRLTTEVIQDLKSVHNLNANDELAKILHTEIAADIDREMIAKMYNEAKVGAQNCTVKGVYDFNTDADGRWMLEKVMGLYVQLEQEATWIALETRRGRGNFIVTSPELASFLTMANLMSKDYNPVGLSSTVNPVGVTYYGKLANRFDVFVDPYLTATTTEGKIYHQVVVGYKGSTNYDAGIIYCPYIPITFHSATDNETFGPIFGLKSRYGLVSNPHYMTADSTNAAAKTNSYFRKFSVITQTTV